MLAKSVQFAERRLHPFIDVFTASLNSLRTNTFARDLFWILFAIDVLLVIGFISVAVLRVLNYEPDPIAFNLDHPHSIPSMWNYVKLMLVGVILTRMSVSKRRLAILIMAAVFLFLFADDYFELHDQWGLALNASQWLTETPLSGLGEPLVYLGLIAVFGPLIWLANRLASEADATFILSLTLGIIVLGFFGICVDVVHALSYGLLASEFAANVLDNLIIIVEDGGEMIAMSLCLWISIVQLNENARTSADSDPVALHPAE